MSNLFQNNNFSATSSVGFNEEVSAQKLQNDLNQLLNDNQNGGKPKRKQRGGNVSSEERLKNEFDILMNELRETGSALPTDLLEGGKRKKVSSKKNSKKLLDGGKRKKVSSKKNSKKLLDGGKRKKVSSKKNSKKLLDGGKRKKVSSKKSSKKLLDGGKRKKVSSKKSSKKVSRKQNRELPAALVAFQKLVKSIVEGLNITGVRKYAFKLAAEYKKLANGDVEDAIKLFNKEKTSGKAKERYDAISK
jgi:hypothetical protein